MDETANPEGDGALRISSGIESRQNQLYDANSGDKASGTDNNCHSDHSSAQSNGMSSASATSALDPPETNQQQQITTNKSQPKPQNSTSGSTTGTVTNAKKARQRLRKGKWTIEEEEYTSRIIQYFSTGLLTLPDGATLRSYLAEKLNCDPMRITKKFTGACCLGRRAYHLRDRPRASPAEVEMANFELMHLEQRFRLRVEHEQTGLPLPPRHELLASQPPVTATTAIPSLFSLQRGTTMKAANPWLQNQIIAPTPAQSSLLPGPTAIIPSTNGPVAATNLNVPHPSLLLAVGQILLQNSTDRAHSDNSSSTAAAAAAAPLQMLNNLVASYALSQALTQQQVGVSIREPPGSTTSPSSSSDAFGAMKSAPPSSTFNFNVSNVTTNMNRTSQPIPIEQRPENVQIYQQLQQKHHKQQQQQHEKVKKVSSIPAVSKKEEHTKKLKAAFEEQQRALRLAYEKSLQDAQEWEEQQFSSDVEATTKGGDSTTSAISASTNSKTLQKTISPAEQLQRSYEAHLASLKRAEEQNSKQMPSKKSISPVPTKSDPAGVEAGRHKSEHVYKTEEEGGSGQKTTSDEEAAAILLGVLNSIRGLRESYEDAVEAKVGSNEAIQKSSFDSEKKSAPMSVKEQLSTEAYKSVKMIGENNTDSSTRTPEKYNRKNHNLPREATNDRLKTSDPITSLSHFQSSKRNIKSATVTETSSSTSSQPTIEQSSSSHEDSKSDKMDHSSSDDTDESEIKIAISRGGSKGPPRKRLKDFHKPHEFTRENLMAHSKRMDMECGVTGDASSSEE